MAKAVIMPRQGQSVESCIMTKWFKSVGDQVTQGDVLFSYETDKASFEEESPVSGILLAQLCEEWDDVPCLENVCVVGEEGEDISEFLTGNQEEASSDEKVSLAEESKDVNEETKSEVSKMVVSGERQDVKVSPRAKNLANQIGIDYHVAAGTGPKDRVIERDVLALKEAGVFVTKAARQAGASGLLEGTALGGKVGVMDLEEKPQETPVLEPGLAYRDEKVTNIRKLIGKAMQTSLSTTAQLTLNTSFDATAILEMRKILKANEETKGITLNDLILFAITRVIKDYEALNAHFMGDTIRYFNHVHLGVAVDTERGLMVPTVFNADTKSLSEISSAVKTLANACKKGSIDPDHLSGASFTVTNLGTFGIESFTPVLNPPQTGILGVSTITNRVKEVAGSLSTYPAMGLSLTFDHSALDGAEGARFLQALTKGLEQFTILLTY